MGSFDNHSKDGLFIKKNASILKTSPCVEAYF